MTARHYGGLIVILATLAALAPMSIDMYLPSLPTLAHEFAVPAAEVQRSLSTFFLGLACGQFIYGPVSDRFGRKPVLFFGLALYLVSSVMCAMATSVSELIALRLVEGLGAAVGPVIARAVVRDVWSDDRAAQAMSYVVMMMTAAPILAPVIGGHLLIWFDWQAIFWLLVGFAVLCLAMVGLLHESHPRVGAGQPSVWHRFAAYAHLLRNRRILAYLVCGGAGFGALFSFITGSAFVYIGVFGIAPEHFGYFFALNMVSIVAANFLNSRLVARFGYRTMLRIAATDLLVFSIVLLACAVLRIGGIWGVIVPMFFATGGIGVVAANSIAGLLNSAPQSAGAASSLFGVVQFLFGTLASICVSSLKADPTTAMALCVAGAAAVAFVAQAALPRQDRHVAVADAS